MVELRVCSFCGKEMEPGTGKMYVKKDGTVYLFCTNKCSKNMIDMSRVPRTVTWTRAYAREKEVRMHAPEAGASKRARAAKKAAYDAQPKYTEAPAEPEAPKEEPKPEPVEAPKVEEPKPEQAPEAEKPKAKKAKAKKE
ncbi:MAG: 50S ribosomal protein L24e [Methanomassiliicoccales archaeon]|nr:50S ribosomal protein L24e [Methanomassiliicoccales archaeon]